MTSAAIYTRISKDSNGDQLGVKRQEEDCRELCRRKGWEVIEPAYVDDDVSAFSGRERAQYERLTEDIRRGRVQAVVAWHPDRLHRNVREHLDFIEVCGAEGVTIATVRGGEIDPANTYAQMSAGILAMVAQAESAHKRERIRRKHQELAEAGAPSGGGARPFGWQPDGVHLDPVEAAEVRRLVHGVLRESKSVASLTRELNERGVPTVGTAPRWRHQVVRNMLLRARLAGLREHRGAVVATGKWEAIITPEEHRELVAVLKDPARSRRRTVRRYELTGIVRCSLCGARMVSRPVDNSGTGRPRYRSYMCSKRHPERLADGTELAACGRMRVAAEPIEELAAAAVFEVLETERLAKRLRQRHDPTGTRQELQDVQRRLIELAEDEAAGLISRAEWRAKRAVLDRRLQAVQVADAARAKDSTLEPYLAGERSLRDDWPRLTADQRRAVYTAVLKAVWIDPAPRPGRFASERVRCEWAA